jgi:hypothetical protein
LFEKLKPTTKNPNRVIQILGVVLEQNETHEKETAEPARTERRKEAKSALNKDHFLKERLEKKQKEMSAKGREDKADNVTQKSEGMEDAPFTDGKTRRSKLKKGERMEDLFMELTFRERPELALAGFKENLKALKRREQQRDPPETRGSSLPRRKRPLQPLHDV